MTFRSAFAVLSMTVALTACGQLPFQQSEPEAPAHSGPPAVSPLDQPIETGADAIPVSTAEARTMSTAMFRAGGSGWTVTAADKTAVYERPGAKSTAITVRRMTYGRGVEFIGTMNGQVFSLNIRAADCDTGDGKAPFSAALRVGSQRLAGCAVPTDTMPKAQVKASSAAPKARAVPKAAAPAAKPAAPQPETPATAPATTPGDTPAADTAAPAPTTAPEPATPAPAPTTPAAPETPAETTGSSATDNAVPAPEIVLPPTPPASQ